MSPERAFLDILQNAITRQFVDAIPASVFVKDAHSRFVMINKQCEDQWGRSFADLYMTDGTGFFPAEQLASFWEQDREILNICGQKEYIETVWNARLKANRTVRTFKRAIADGASGGTFLVAISIDISEQSRAEGTLVQLDHKLHSVMAQMTSSLAHEVNQPLTAVSNWIQAARRKLLKTNQQPPQDVLDYLDNAIEQTLFASKVVSNLRDFVVKGETELAPACINAAIEESLTVALVGAHRLGVSLNLDFAPDLPDVLIDKVQVQQVIINLARNAIQAMKKVNSRELTIKTGLSHDGRVEVLITDTGAGLDAEIRDHLFQPFVSTKAKGMGLGLSICKAIVESHGGHLLAEPGAGCGTTFRFSLPVHAEMINASRLSA
jgi:two-component system sensor kinase FixL